jgi:hypothetical protein
MSWCAETDHGQLGSGTILSIFEQSWESGLRRRALRPRATLAVRFPHGAIAQIDVVEVNATRGAIVQASNGKKWRMVQVAVDEHATSAPRYTRSANYTLADHRANR